MMPENLTDFTLTDDTLSAETSADESLSLDKHEGSASEIIWPTKVRHIIIVTEGSGSGEGTRYDLWTSARDGALWTSMERTKNSDLAILQIDIEKNGVLEGTATMLLEDTDNEYLKAYLNQRAGTLKADEELLIVAHKPTWAGARPLAEPGRIWTRRLRHMATIPLYRAVKELALNATTEAFEVLCGEAKLQPPQWTAVADLIHDCLDKLKTPAWALKSWAEANYAENYYSDSEAKTLQTFANHGKTLAENVKLARVKIYGAGSEELLSVKQAYGDVVKEAEVVAQQSKTADLDGARLRQVQAQVQAVEATIARMKCAWRTIEVLLPPRGDTVSKKDLAVNERPLHELRVQAFGENYGGGLLGHLLDLVQAPDVYDLTDYLEQGDPYSHWFHLFSTACQKLEEEMRLAEKQLQQLNKGKIKFHG